MQWNFLPCGSLCGESSTPLPFQERGGLNAVGAWDILKQRGTPAGKGARVAVLDTGAAYMTRKPKFRHSPDFSRKQFLPGYDFVDKDRVPLDEDGHGTHVTGTIAERTGNHFGLTGLASRAKIIPVRVLDSEGFGTARNIAKGIRWAANHKAQVINMSFEFSLGVNSCGKIKGICSAVKYAFKRGALVVAAAGNENGEPVAYPAGAPHVLGVGRTTKDACLASDSRTGAGLDLVAPGGGFPLLATCGSDDGLFSRGVRFIDPFGEFFHQPRFPPNGSARNDTILKNHYLTRIRVQRDERAHRQCQIESIVAGREASEDRDAKWLQVFFEQRMYIALLVGFFAFFIRESTKQNASDRRQLICQLKLRQIPIDPIDSFADILQK